MLTSDQKAQFASEGYLVIEDLVDPATLDAVFAEYAALLDDLWKDWRAKGLVGDAPADAGF